MENNWTIQNIKSIKTLKKTLQSLKHHAFYYYDSNHWTEKTKRAVNWTLYIIIPNTAVFVPTNFIETIGTARLKISAEDFYGGRTGPLEKFYLFFFIFFIYFFKKF